jgi:hypothetical protein
MRNDKEVQFRYNATVPTTIEQFKKKNRVDIAREKLVDRVKKLKRQAPRVGHHHQVYFNHLKLTQQRDDPTFFHNNYSESKKWVFMCNFKIFTIFIFIYSSSRTAAATTTK